MRVHSQAVRILMTLFTAWIFSGVSLMAYDQATLLEGQKLFMMKGCSGCHSVGQGVRSGPDLKGVFSRRPKDWLRKWVKNPAAVFAANDPTALALYKTYHFKMPSLNLSDEQVEAVLTYVKALDEGVAIPAASGTHGVKAKNAE